MDKITDRMYRKSLISRDNKGNLVSWHIAVMGYTDHSKILISYGKYDGTLAEKEIKINEGKNIGKSNATTHFEQAIKQAESKINDKLNSGYVEFQSSKNFDDYVPMDKLDSMGDIKPMLAYPFKEHRAVWPCIIQPKLNGVRCEAKLIEEENGLFGKVYSVQLKSRDGKIYKVPHIQDDLLKLYEVNPELHDVIFDGELYCYGMLLQDIVSAVKKHNHNSSKIEYHIYDTKCDIDQRKRLLKLNSIGYNTFNYISIKFVKYHTAYHKESAEAYAESFIQVGYEGAILRNPTAMYQSRRTYDLMKIKKVFDKEFLLVDIIESGNDTYKGQPIGMFICRNDKTDATFKVTPQATKKERHEYLINKDKYLGKDITVTFRERTKDKLPFHANGIIRDYE